ncbi:MAG: ECF transporter S component [Deltaproteobacteria bacterium]|nr:ECF transporter S component [Deltaproteobacteria bacterium]
MIPFTNARLYVYAACFVAADVAIPRFFHWLHPLAGPLFQPMYFIILLAGLMMGWRGGLLVGIATPLVSFVLSGMPPHAVLPRVFMECVCYGFIAGMMRERYRTNTVVSVVTAIIAGRIVTAAFLLLLPGYGIPAVSEIMWGAVNLGWPGIGLQIILLPLMLHLLEYNICKES